VLRSTTRKAFIPLDVVFYFVLPISSYLLTYIFVGNSDRENYGTTIYPLLSKSSPQPSFLGLPLGDLHIAFGTNFPILSDLQLFFPLGTFDSFLFPFSFLFWVALFSLLILKSYYKILELLQIKRTFWTLSIGYLLVVNPSCLDSLFYNDWPGTFFASQLTMIMWLRLASCIVLGEHAKTLLILILGFSLIVLSDPGYAPISFFGAVATFIISQRKIEFKNLQIREMASKFEYKSSIVITLTSLVSLTYVLVLVGQQPKFTTGLREMAPATNTFENILNTLNVASILYRPRSHWLLFIILLTLLNGILKNNAFRCNFISIIPGNCLILIFVFTTMSIMPESFTYRFPLSPTANFFYRDIVFFIFVLYLIEITRFPGFNKLRRVVLIIFICSLGITMYQKHDPLVSLSQKSWVTQMILAGEKDNFENQFLNKVSVSDLHSVGIVISESAYSQIRNGSLPNFWMPTDIVGKNYRLVTVITKVQSKDFFSVSPGIFHASTVNDQNWCSTSVTQSLWLDYLITSKSDLLSSDCAKPIAEIGNLRLIQLNPTPSIYKFRLSTLNASQKVNPYCNVKLKTLKEATKIEFGYCNFSSEFLRNGNIPFHNYKELKVSGSRLLPGDTSDSGFAIISGNDFKRGAEVVISYKASILMMFRISLIWLTHIYLLILFLQMSVRFLRRCNSVTLVLNKKRYNK
jgi:hypothetical protein